MKRFDVDIYFPESRMQTTVWVEDNATEAEIREAVMQEAISMIEVDYREHEEWH